MEKIRVSFILVITSLILLGCFERNEKKSSEKSNFESSIMEDSSRNVENSVHNKDVDIIDCKYYNGKWSEVDNNSSQNFTIELKVEGNKVCGSYCFVYGKSGEKIDCPEGNSINTYCFDNCTKGKLISAWADDSISIELKLVSKDTLSIMPLSDAGQSFFQMPMFFTRKK